MKIKTCYTFEQVNNYIGQLIIAFSDINKGVEYKFMKDESGKDIQAIILHDSGPEAEFDRYSLIIKYLDKSLVRSYDNVIFTMKFKIDFDYLYEELKENDYIEYRFNN